MTTGYASGKYAVAHCARCGFRFPYLSIRQEAETGLRVCRECLDEPQPKRRVPAVREALRHPTPDRDES